MTQNPILDALLAAQRGHSTGTLGDWCEGSKLTRHVARVRHAVRWATAAFRRLLMESTLPLGDFRPHNYLDTAHRYPPPSGVPSAHAPLDILHGVPTHDALVGILAEISELHDGLHLSADDGTQCHCGERLGSGEDVPGIHRAHIAGIQAIAIAEALQAARTPGIDQIRSFPPGLGLGRGDDGSPDSSAR
jgi:hypothetical protein